MFRWLLGATFAVSCLFAAPSSQVPQFHRDVEPIFEQKCDSCHRPGEPAPMSLLSYQNARLWANDIRYAITSGSMPPWFADPKVGRFSNDRSLTPVQVQTILEWIKAGAPEGSVVPRRSPHLEQGWNIGKPDAVFVSPKPVPVKDCGAIEYRYIILPTHFAEDKYIEAVEVRPTNYAVTHHIAVFVREPGSPWLADGPIGTPFYLRDIAHDNSRAQGEFLANYAPGTIPQIMGPGRAKLIKAGSDLVLQVHYTAYGKATEDIPRVGLIFAKQKPAERVLTLACFNSTFLIPPGDSNYQVKADLVLHQNATLLSLMPHMHLRGKSFNFQVTYPNGRTEPLLDVPHYTFNWQISYMLQDPLSLPAGSRLGCTAAFDNSAANPKNPDPSKSVRFGEQSWDEMMVGYFNVAVRPDVTERDVLLPKVLLSRARN